MCLRTGSHGHTWSAAHLQALLIIDQLPITAMSRLLTTAAQNPASLHRGADIGVLTGRGKGWGRAVPQPKAMPARGLSREQWLQATAPLGSRPSRLVPPRTFPSEPLESGQ